MRHGQWSARDEQRVGGMVVVTLRTLLAGSALVVAAGTGRFADRCEITGTVSFDGVDIGKPRGMAILAVAQLGLNQVRAVFELGEHRLRLA